MKNRALRHALWLLFALYMAALLRLTVFRQGAFANGLFTGRFSLVPAVGYVNLWRWRSYGRFFYLLLGNIGWFMPLGGYIRLRGRGLCAALLWGIALSVAIEWGQFVLGTGLSETDDVLLNTLGAGLGYGCVLLCQRFARRWGRPVRAQGQ